MSEGQRVRWWREEQEQGQAKAASEAVERTYFVPTLLVPQTAAAHAVTVEDSEFENDTWAELEAEAARRASQAKTGASESVSFYTDKTAALARYRRYRRTTLPLAIVALSVNFLYAAFMFSQIPDLYRHHVDSSTLVLLSPFLNMICGMFPLFVFMYVKRRCEWMQKSEEPAVRLSSNGIHLHTPEYKNALLRWEDFVSVQHKGSGKYSRLELLGTNKRRMVIYEYYMPFAAKKLATRIADYKAARAMD